MSQTSLILKNSLSGISGVGILQPLLDYNRRPREWESLANPVLDEALEGKVQLLEFVGKHHKGRRIRFDLGDVADLHVGRQSAAGKGLLAEKFVEFPGGNPHKPRFMHLIDRSI